MAPGGNGIWKYSGKRLRPGLYILIKKVFFQYWISNIDIPPDEEKEEEWEINMAKSLHICSWNDRMFPKIQTRSAHNKFSFTPRDAIASYFPHDIRRDNSNNKCSYKEFGQTLKTY
jgi:hypothetical protein